MEARGEPVAGSSGARSDLALQVGDEGLDVGLPQLRELDVAEPGMRWRRTADSLTSEGRWSLVQRVRCSPFLEPSATGTLALIDGFTNVPRTRSASASDSQRLASACCREGVERGAAARQPRPVAA